MAPWMTEGAFVECDSHTTLTFSVPPGGDPSCHSRIAVPGHGGTFGGLAFVIPEIKTAWLWTHETPWLPPIKLSQLRTMAELVRVASGDHGQIIVPE